MDEAALSKAEREYQEAVENAERLLSTASSLYLDQDADDVNDIIGEARQALTDTIDACEEAVAVLISIEEMFEDEEDDG